MLSQNLRCLYQTWGELVCNGDVVMDIFSSPNIANIANITTNERFVDAEDAYRHGEGVHPDLVTIIDPKLVPKSPFVILFEERPKIDRDDGSFYPPYYGNWVVIPTGYHKGLGLWNDRAKTVFVPRGTKVSLYDQPNGDDLFASHTVPKGGVPMVVNLYGTRHTLSSMMVEIA
jgi:hypothetical protein